MKSLFIICTFSLCVLTIFAQKNNFRSETAVPQPKAGIAVDEVVVESSLYIRKKPQVRRIRAVNSSLLRSVKVKRQTKGKKPLGFGSSQSASNAAANSNFLGPNGFGASAANAQAQGFQSKGPLGGFGSSAANTQTQSFTAGNNGLQGSAAASTSQVYKLPNGKEVNVVFSNGFSAGPNGISGSNANGVTIS